ASSHQDADAAVGFEQRSELIEAFGRLPARQREVLALRYYVDMSVADAAAAHQRRRRPLDRLPWPRCAGPDPPVPFLEGGVRHAGPREPAPRGAAARGPEGPARTTQAAPGPYPTAQLASAPAPVRGRGRGARRHHGGP